MAQSAGLHEPAESLTPDVIDRHRAITSLQEELEAVDWYDQRVAATDDESLAEILAHNRDEGKENAAMTIEGLRGKARRSTPSCAPTCSPNYRSSKWNTRPRPRAAVPGPLVPATGRSGPARCRGRPPQGPPPSR